MVRFSSKVIFILSAYLSFVLSAAIATDDSAYNDCLEELNQRFSGIRSQSNPNTKPNISRKSNSNSRSSSPPEKGTIKRQVGKRFKEFSELKYSNIKNNENNQQQIPELPEELLSLLGEAGKSEFDGTETVSRLFEEALGIRLENITVREQSGGFVSGKIYRVTGKIPGNEEALGIRLENITVREQSGGFVSGKIYRVTGKIPGNEEEKTYFIKYLRPSFLISKKRCRTEVINLEYIQNLIRDGHLKTGGFTFIFPLVSYTYKVSKKSKIKSKIFTISEGAKGRSLTDIVQTGSKEEINNVFKVVGETLANLHYENTYQFVEGEFNKRMVNNLGVPAHCDLHGDNIFCYYDEESSLYLPYCIDNETLRNSYYNENNSWIAPVIYDIG